MGEYMKKNVLKHSLKKILSANLAFAAFLFLSFSFHDAAISQESCYHLFKSGPQSLLNRNIERLRIFQQPEAVLHDRSLAVQRLAMFATRHRLPSQWFEFGPGDRKVKRLMVALDINNETQMAAYRETFNLATPLAKSDPGSGTLVIEQTWENPKRPEHYIYTYIRASKNPGDPVYRWGRKDSSWTGSFTSIRTGITEHESGLVGLGHLIELNSAENDNVKIFLDNGNLRGPCKSGNCVAWLTGAELGVTSKEATDEQRKYLFNELGVSRTIAPFEISRRLTHASNERHGALIVFVNGAADQAHAA